MSQRVLFINFNETIVLGALEQVLKSDLSNFERVYHIGNSRLSSKVEGTSNYVFMCFWDAINLPLSTQDGEVIDADLLASLAKYEYQLLLMLGRTSKVLDLRFHNLTLRRHLYYMHLGFWLNYLRTNKINKILFFEIPHAGFDYVIYLLAVRMNLKIVICSHSQIADTMFVSDSVCTLYDDIGVSYQQKLKEEAYNITPSGRAQKEFNLRCSQQAPYYMIKTQEKAFNKYKRYLKLLSMNSISTVYARCCTYYRRNKLIKRELLVPAIKACSEVSLTDKYIYFALHLQPECTTLPMGGRYVDQYLAIKLLVKHLPKGMKLYVKEHPTMYTYHDPSGRFKEFYELIYNLPNVKMVKPNISTFELIKCSQAVATITGTVGWEALFQEKNVFVFGNIFYKYCHGVYPISSEKDVIESIDKIFNQKKQVDLNKVKLYFKAIEECSFWGTSYGDLLKISERSLEENVEFVSNLLRNLIKHDFKLTPKIKYEIKADLASRDLLTE